MKTKMFFCWILFAGIFTYAYCQKFKPVNTSASIDYIEALKDTLNALSANSNNTFFKMHCEAMISVINSKTNPTVQDSAFLKNTYGAFNNQSDPANAKKLSTYLERQRPFILSWVSPTDGEVSFSWLTPPKDWDPEKEYPLYIQLHGLWSVASNTIEYLTYPYLTSASASISFEDGYLLSPWGRGNFWYQGRSETDIWECMAALEHIVHIDPSRKYLSGHSMGGYGAWYIASKSPNIWAALGIHAGALWYDDSELVTSGVANKLKDVPTYFVCGTNDNLLPINQTAYHLLETAGNPNIKFVTFVGAHDYIEENVKNMYLWMRNFVNENEPTISKETGEVPQSEFRIYPNPVVVNSNIAISVSANHAMNISIYDLQGRFIEKIRKEEMMLERNSVAFDTAGLPAGIYLVRMESVNAVVDLKLVLTPLNQLIT